MSRKRFSPFYCPPPNFSLVSSLPCLLSYFLFHHQFSLLPLGKKNNESESMDNPGLCRIKRILINASKISVKNGGKVFGGGGRLCERCGESSNMPGRIVHTSKRIASRLCFCGASQMWLIITSTDIQGVLTPKEEMLQSNVSKISLVSLKLDALVW